MPAASRQRSRDSLAAITRSIRSSPRISRSAAQLSWAWYSGGWSNAEGDVGAPGWTNGTTGTCTDPYSIPNPTYPNCPNKVFQYHHQPFNYYANYAPGLPGRTHLQDEQAFKDLAGASGKA